MNTHGPLQDVTGLTGRPVPGAHRKAPARAVRTQAARRILVSALVAASLGSAAAVSLASSTGGPAPASTHQLARVPATTLRGPWMYAVSGGRPWMYAPQP